MQQCRRTRLQRCRLAIAESLLLFKLVVMAGLALWLTLGTFNNLSAFSAGVASLGNLMGMRLLDQEPAIRTPLLARRVTSPV